MSSTPVIVFMDEQRNELIDRIDLGKILAGEVKQIKLVARNVGDKAFFDARVSIDSQFIKIVDGKIARVIEPRGEHFIILEVHVPESITEIGENPRIEMKGSYLLRMVRK